MFGLYGDDDEDDPYGVAVAIEHDFGWDNQPLYTLYAHLSEATVEKGDFVQAGDPIALSGDTGFTTAPHLHYEVIEKGKKKNQEVILENVETLEEYRGVSYGVDLTVNGDPFYQENFVLSDIPAGLYKIRIPYFGYVYERFIRVHPGAVSYFRYRGLPGFSDFYPYHDPPGNMPPVPD